MNKKESKIIKEMKTSKESPEKVYSNQDGITLIVLVVTIVVLLILAGVTINAIFGENGIIKMARDAQNKVDQASQNDLDAINGLNEFIDNTTNGGTGGDDDSKTPFGGEKYDKAEKNVDGTLKKNAEYTDSEKATVTIPKGFKVSDVAATGDTDGEQTISKGLVIQDTNGNEFVWIPVNYTATGTLDEDGLDSGFKAVFKRADIDESAYLEPYDSGYEGEETEYIEMMQSVQANKGFYIGRYEAGTTEPRTNLTTTSSDVVVKRDSYPYIYVGWGNSMKDIAKDVTYSGKLRGKGAVYLGKHMYDNKDIGATSTLCYGVQRDAVMNFVKTEKAKYDVDTNSTSWGNYKSNEWTINRTTASFTTSPSSGDWTQIDQNGKNKTDSESILLTTGASDIFKAKNIFDLAGNVYEWTMEVNPSAYRVGRGGYYVYSGSSYPASVRIRSNPTTSNSNVGFRTALYL